MPSLTREEADTQMEAFMAKAAKDVPNAASEGHLSPRRGRRSSYVDHAVLNMSDVLRRIG